jgi:two-component system, OmpR family, response regulator
MHVSSHLLLIEDDAEIRTMVSCFMRGHGFQVSAVTNAAALDRVMGTNKIDLLLLDLMLPGEDGLSICRRVRTVSAVPIIILTGLGTETDRVTGLEMGADDYLTKPFSTRELLARVRAVLRRGRLPVVSASQSTVLVFDKWRLSLTARRLCSPAGLHVPLTSTEFDVLSVFCQQAGRILSREQLLDLAHGRSAAQLDRSIDVQISRLRRKIEPDPREPTMIVTVRNGGYMFTPTVALFSGTQ